MRAIVPSMFEATVQLSHAVPADMAGHALNGTTTECMHEPRWGCVLTQQLARCNFSFWKYALKMEEDTEVQFYNRRPVLALFVPEKLPLFFAQGAFVLEPTRGYVQMAYLPEGSECKIACPRRKELVFFQVDFNAAEVARTAQAIGDIPELAALLGAAETSPRIPASLEDMPLAKKEKELFEGLSERLELPGAADFFLDTRIANLLWWYLSQLGSTGYETFLKKVGFFVTRQQFKYIRALQSDLGTDFTGSYPLAEIAEKAGLHPRKLQLAFRMDTGETLSSFRTKARLAKAADLLRETDRTIKGIALTVGIRHKGDFNKAFKKEFGVSPLDWRRNNKQQA